MSDIFSAFADKLTKVVSPKSKLVLAFSGGIDSRVLLELMAQYSKQHKVDCVAVHVNHGLSSHANTWATLCLRWCRELDVPLYIENVELDLSKADSVEKLARDARYQALQKHISESDILVTGQHADDQLETFLLALKRGSGPKGLAAMPENKCFGEGIIVRPLLDVSRKQIEQYANKQQLDWVEDESNQDTRFDRNFIRHQITPALTERWPSFTQSVRRSAHLCAEQEALLDELLQETFQSLVSDEGCIDIAGLAACSDRARLQLLRMWIARCGYLMPSHVQLNKIWHEVALASADANPQLNTNDGQFRRFDNKLYLLQPMSDISSWQSHIRFDSQIELPDGLGKVVLSRTSHSANIAIPKGKEEALNVSFNPEGLSAHPVGRNHNRKLKKLFQEYKVPSWLRRRTPILICEGQVVAVAGLFIDKAFNGQECELIWDKPSQTM